MPLPDAPRKVAKDELIGDARDLTAGPGVYASEHELRAALDGVLELDAERSPPRVRVRAPRKPVAGARRRRGMRDPEDAAQGASGDKGSRREAPRGAERLKRKKGMGDQGAWI